MKKPSNGNMPTTEQLKRDLPGQDLCCVTSKARSKEFDLEPVASRTRIGSWGDEGTHMVVKRGNKVTESGNY